MTSFNFAPYQPATYCYGEPQRGNLYLAAFIEEMFPETRLLNIYSCRDIVGGSALSHHAEGRANNEGVPQHRPPDGVSIARRILEMLGPHGKALGMDHAIINEAPWLSGRGRPRSYSAADPTGRVYTGLHNHKDHGHFGTTRVGSARLTLTTIRAIVLGVPIPKPELRGDDLTPLTVGEKREDVRMLKLRLNETYETNLDVAGSSGPLYDGDTVVAVKNHLGSTTNDPEGKAGRRVVGKQWNALELAWHRTNQ